MRSLSWERLILPLLAALTFTVYSQVGEHDFVNFDDGKYVFDNPQLERGLTVDGVTWAFSSIYFSNWHPLTWVSYLLDYELYGLKPGGYHLTNLLLHVAATMLLFVALRRLTGAIWRSAFVAALFGLHPLHVESVAWVGERKDVLSGLFWMAVLWAYARYAARPSWVRYLLVAVLLALGLMAKPMLVTLPFVLLLLDYWPLRRLGNPASPVDWTRLKLLTLEKLPLMLLAAGSSWITWIAQSRGGAVVELEELSLGLRAGNALVAYVAYIAKALWPADLAVFYPHPGTSLSLALAFGSLLLLAAISLLAFRFADRRPYLPIGWLWYLGTLVPVIGLVQVGRQGLADRYTYLPLIGLFMIAAWGGHDLLARWRFGRRSLVPGSLAVLCALSAATWVQVSHWKDSVTLFRQALRVTSDNAVAHFNLGSVLLRRGDDEDGLAHLVAALRLNPGSFKLHASIAMVLANRGRHESARQLWGAAIWGISEMYGRSAPTARSRSHQPDAVPASTASRSSSQSIAEHLRLGASLARGTRMEEAMAQFEEALRLEPASVEAHLGLGSALLARNRRPEAMRHYLAALNLRPDSAAAHYRLAIALMLDDRMTEAAKHVADVLHTDPEHRGARFLMRKIREELTAETG
ncbi:MAG: tetratricopeptide repeat protein [Myxococcota bacterium]